MAAGILFGTALSLFERRFRVWELSKEGQNGEHADGTQSTGTQVNVKRQTDDVWLMPPNIQNTVSYITTEGDILFTCSVHF